MRAITISLFVLLLSAGAVFAQECGPNCPVCSGAGGTGGTLVAPRSIMFSAMSIPGADEERAVFAIRYGLFSWLDAGVGYAARTEEVLWNLRFQPLTERSGWRPGVVLGTGSVRTGGTDQSLYVQLVKSWDAGPALNLNLSAGAATLAPDFDESFGLAGATVTFLTQFGVFATYDGASFHEGASWSPSEWLSLSFLMVESDLPAIAATLRL
ncbi:MAG: hypothetical protein ABIE70_12215 [bacterium]